MAAVLALGVTCFPAQPPQSQPASAEAELLSALRQQPIGAHTLDDLQLPEHFLRRCSDRLIRTAFERQFRIVVRDPAVSTQPDVASQPDDAPPPPASAPAIRIVRYTPSPPAAALARLPEARPERRNFRVTVTSGGVDVHPKAPPDSGPLTRLIATRLARDGLLSTLVQALQSPDLQPLVTGGDPVELARRLDAAGFPTDLLAAFRRDDSTVLEESITRLVRGDSAESVTRAIEQRRFVWTCTDPSFRAADESGDEPIGLLRLQLTRGVYWQGVGDGCSLDMARQLVAAAPELPLLVSLQRDNEAEFIESLRRWTAPPRDLTLVLEPAAVAQWAQDNGKAGTIRTPAGSTAAATLVPRFASRGEDGSSFVAGESLLAHGLIEAGHVVRFSPLLFQGGNLLVATHPATRERLLLIGEAEIYRNTAMGLTSEQVVEAFRCEFGVDRCIVLPAAAFHIDAELCLRGLNGRLTAFVNDAPRGARLVLEAAVDALRRGGLLSAADAGAARRCLATNAAREFLGVVAPPVMAKAVRFGQFPESVTTPFSSDGVDSAVGNFQRFLVALDLLTLEALAPDEHPQSAPARDYLAAMRRINADRAALHEQLRREGFDIVMIPGLPGAERGIHYVNGIHDCHRYLMPVYGGLYAGLDAAAADAFRSALGPDVAIIPIGCSESQRRAGALHCSVAAYPATRGPASSTR